MDGTKLFDAKGKAADFFTGLKAHLNSKLPLQTVEKWIHERGKNRRVRHLLSFQRSKGPATRLEFRVFATAMARANRDAMNFSKVSSAAGSR